MSAASFLVPLTRADGRSVTLEAQWITPQQEQNRPLLVFLHEGLGSVQFWRDFPQRLCDAAGCRGLVYSRAGYGASTPRPADELWQPDYLHRQALEDLPLLLAALNADHAPVWLFGHSDGGSIALIAAARRPDLVGGIIVLAPHILVEQITLDGIRDAAALYRSSDWRDRLARGHADPDSAFWGWNNAWSNPPFRDWSITGLLAQIRCPVLAIQGEGDEYATMLQIDGIARHAPQTRLLKLADCRHSPHRDQPDAVIAASCALLQAERHCSD